MATKAKQKDPKQKDISSTIAKSLLSYIKGIDSKKLEKKVKKFSKEFAAQINKAIAKSKKNIPTKVAKKSQIKKVVKGKSSLKAES